MKGNDFITDCWHNKRQRNRTPRGKCPCGHIYDRNPNQPQYGGSIPTRFQRMLMPRNISLIKPNNRLEYKHYYKALFNKEPGPGSYSVSTDPNSKSPSVSMKGFGNGFTSEEDRLNNRDASFEYPNIGPGIYNPEKPRPKSLVSRVFAYTGRQIADNDDMLKLNIPFDENNPLNYIKPISLNVYVKPVYPGPGEYNVNTSTLVSNGCMSAFKPNINQAKKSSALKQDIPGVGQYSIKSVFEESSIKKHKEKRKKYENQSMTYDWLEEKAVLINKNYTKEISVNPSVDIVNYGKLYEVQKAKNEKEKLEITIENTRPELNLSAPFAITDLDRFGEQVRPKKPLELKPGPEDYDINFKAITKNVNAPKYRTKIFSGVPKKKEIHPGPAFYNPQREADKLSFHLNVTRKWL